MSVVEFGGILVHLCVYCGTPAEIPNGDRSHVCHHRDFFGGRGHRAHAVCCARHVSGNDGSGHRVPCPTVHVAPLKENL